MFNVNAASFAIDDKRILHPVDLAFSQGRLYGLIGHNGSGKSTLLKLLARQQPVSQGDIEFDGKPLSRWGKREFARQVAYLPQHLPATENLTGRELIDFGRYPWRGLLGRKSAEDRRQIERAMALTHTESFADRLVDTLSGGERQRVWLAMLLAQGSRFLLLDEPLAALDIAHQIEVLSLVKNLSQELDLGVIIVMHDINLAARYCDHLVALHSGKLLEQGAPERIMRPATLQSIYGIAMQILASPQSRHPIAVVN
ncbi:ABC transporter ATP-binding protein [Pistricoccus aurantiacus]|uniref:ABC transporter ATP-binding protein n=1 Tax=Pistricoccus aurantiacus TaxID=1883414 RepID=UPI00362C2976